MEGTDFRQECFEQGTLFRRKLFLELSQEIVSCRFSFSRRVRLKSDKVPDFSQELYVILFTVLVVGQVIGTKELSVATRSRATAGVA